MIVVDVVITDEEDEELKTLVSDPVEVVLSLGFAPKNGGNPGGVVWVMGAAEFTVDAAVEFVVVVDVVALVAEVGLSATKGRSSLDEAFLNTLRPCQDVVIVAGSSLSATPEPPTAGASLCGKTGESRGGDCAGVVEVLWLKSS